MASASFNDGNHGLQIGSNTGPITTDQSSLDLHYPSPRRRGRENSPEESSSGPDKPRSKRARRVDDDNSISSYGSEFWREVSTRQESPRNALGPSQPSWNTEGHRSPRDSPANRVSQSDNSVSSSGNDPENDSDNEGVELWDNNSDSLEDEQLSDSSSSSEEDSE
ncbi:hypothetical protein N7527_004835 [Penicillium freii]|nr:hypothetical protein N7527_004835 [Penicillium freii]